MATIYARLVGCMILWGLTFVAMRYMSFSLGPASNSFMRFGMAAVLLMFMSARMDPNSMRPTRSELSKYFVLGAIGVFAYNFLLMAGLTTVSAGRGAIIISMNPVLTACLAAVFLGETLRGTRAAGVAVSLLGAFTVLTGGDYMSFFHGMSSGDLLLCGAALCWSGYSVIGKQVMRNSSPIASVSWSITLGSCLLLPAALAEGLVSDLPNIGWLDWGCIVYMAVFSTGFGLIWFYQGIQAIGAARAAAFMNLMPVFAAIFGYILLGETLAWATLGGGALVLAGVWLTNRPQKEIVPDASPVEQES